MHSIFARQNDGCGVCVPRLLYVGPQPAIAYFLALRSVEYSTKIAASAKGLDRVRLRLALKHERNQRARSHSLT